MVKRRRKRASSALFAWVSVGVVVAVVLTIVLVKTLGSSGPQKNAFGLAPPSVFHELTNVPASVFDAVGITSSVIPITPSSTYAVVTKRQPAFTVNVNGKKLPGVFYYGGEYCPYCAVTRWGIIVALSRFGTFKNNALYYMFSSSTDTAPSTPTFSFYNTTYTSPYFGFKGYEIVDRNRHTLMTPPTSVQKLVAKYDNGGNIPFMDMGNKTFILSSAFDPTTFAGYTTQEAIASQLSNPSNYITQAIVVTANYVTAGLCATAKNPPASVCTSSAVKKAAHVLHLTL